MCNGVCIGVEMIFNFGIKFCFCFDKSSFCEFIDKFYDFVVVFFFYNFYGCIRMVSIYKYKCVNLD